MTLAMQAMIFGVMLLLGTALGVWADLLRFVTRQRGKLAKAVLDTFFWATVTCLVFIVLFQLNFLELRLYAFASMILGGFLYFRFFSLLVNKFYGWIFPALAQVGAGLAKISRPLLYPLRLIAFILDGLVVLILAGLAAFALKLQDIVRARKELPPPA